MKLGLASTLETLCGQAYGAKNYRMLGVYLQSSYIVCTGAAFLILALWMNVAAILKAMGQDPEIARLAERYLMYMSPGVFGAGILRPTVKFLQSQSVVMPVLLCSFVAFAFHIPCCYIMIHVLEFGFIGGAVSNAITYQFLTVLVFLYSWLSGSCKHTLTGFTWEAFSYLDVYLKLAIPSTFMLWYEVALPLFSFHSFVRFTRQEDGCNEQDASESTLPLISSVDEFGCCHDS